MISAEERIIYESKSPIHDPLPNENYLRSMPSFCVILLGNLKNDTSLVGENGVILILNLAGNSFHVFHCRSHTASNMTCELEITFVKVRRFLGGKIWPE